MTKSPKFIVVIGASAGGLNALAELVKSLEKGIDVAYCIVLHLSQKAVGDFVVNRLTKVTSLRCSLAKNGTPLEKDHIYIGRPNQHMLVKENKLVLGAGPEENRFRPSIDVLFRSAAVAYSSRVIGIILSGMLDDGTSGMWAIKRSGGTCLVQHPDEAEYPNMVQSVMNHMKVDHAVKLGKMGPLLSKIVKLIKGKKKPVPKDVIAEAQIAEHTAVGINDVKKLGTLSIFACPDCGGGLWDMKGDIIKRYRCHIGHAYSVNDLMLKQSQSAGNTLWVALRMMEERKHLLQNMEIESKKGGRNIPIDNGEKQDEMQRHIDKLKEILFDLQNHDTA